jgi:hypothetical protein
MMKLMSSLQEARFYDVKRSKCLEIYNEFFLNPLNFTKICNEVTAISPPYAKIDPTTRDRYEWNESGGEYQSAAAKIDGWTRSWTLDSSEPNEGWLNFSLLARGALFEKNMEKVPTLSNFLRKHSCHINIAGLSCLLPGVYIPPHEDGTGFMLKSVVYHIPIIVPQEEGGPTKACWLEVNGEKRFPEKGVPMAFNGMLTHSAANDTSFPRVILFMDIAMDEMEMFELVAASPPPSKKNNDDKM